MSEATSARGILQALAWSLYQESTVFYPPYIVEDQNFALFNYVNELNGEIEMIQEGIAQIKADIEQFKSQGMEMEEKRKAILRDLEDELSSITDKTGSFTAKFTAATKVLEQLMSGEHCFSNCCHVKSRWGEIGFWINSRRHVVMSTQSIILNGGVLT